MSGSFVYGSVQLNSDLHVAGEFLFDGFLELYSLHSDVSQAEPRLFGTYYKISVGIERLQKVIVLLDVDPSDESDLRGRENRLLFRHSHAAMGAKIEGIFANSHPAAALTKSQKRLLNSLAEYYNQHRYGYYHFGGGTEPVSRLLVDFVGCKEQYLATSPLLRPLLLREAADVFGHELEGLVEKYVGLIALARGRYFTDEVEYESKLAAIKYHAGHMLSFLSLRELAIWELIARLGGHDYAADFVDPVDGADHMLLATAGGPCMLLVDALVDHYQLVCELSLRENPSYVQRRTAELRERLCAE